MPDNKFMIKTRQTRNPRNFTSELFKTLTRLFSGPLVNYRKQTEKTLKQKALNKYASKFKSVSGQQFRRTQYNPFEQLNTSYMVNHQRAQRYAEFSQCEFNPDISSVLDLYADEITYFSHLDPMLKINCSNEEIKEVLKVLYHDVLNVNFNLFGWARTLCKYGDFFLYLDIDEEDGIKNVIGLPSEEVERIEGEDKDNPNYVQFQWNASQMTFENWQVAHFRILGQDKFWPYGTSIIDPARRIAKQLTLLEDAMMSYRIVRSPERKVFYIDVGNVAPEEVEQYVQKVMTSMKRNQIVDSDSGHVDLRYNPLSVEEDYYIPVRGASGTKIESLPGGAYTGDIDDVKYLRDKLFSALKVPMSYLSRGEQGSEDKTSLAQKDIRFSRTIQRIQRCIISELEKVGMIHLYILGFRGEDLLSFNLALNNPSKVADLQELETWRTKFETASSAVEGYFSRRFIAEKFFGLSSEEFLRNQREMFYDRMLDAQFESIATAGEEGGLGGGGGDLGGDESLGGESSATEEPPEEDDSMLLTSPEGGAAGGDDFSALQEKEEPHLTPGSKGKEYTYTDDDKRDMGARKRKMKSKYSAELGSNTRRNVFKGIEGLLERKEASYVEKDGGKSGREEKSVNKNNEVMYQIMEGLRNRKKGK